MEIVKRCPKCNKTLIDVNEERVTINLCRHYIWYSDLGTIANDEMVLRGGASFRLLSR